MKSTQCLTLLGVFLLRGLILFGVSPLASSAITQNTLIDNGNIELEDAIHYENSIKQASRRKITGEY